MTKRTIISAQPKCRICGEYMKSWDPFAKTHAHVGCIAEEISDKLIKVISKQLNDGD